MSPVQPTPPRAAVNQAIQKLTATRLGRGFIPFGLLFIWGMGAVVRGGSLMLPGGAVVSAGVMLAYGLRTVQRALGNPERLWMSGVALASVIPPVFSVYVLGWLGLRGFTGGFSAPAYVSATLLCLLGVWALRAWMRVVEIERLARIMTMNLDGEGGTA